MEAARQVKYYTIDDIHNLPDGQRAELIDGELYMMATPGRIHQKLVMVLSNNIFSYIQSRNGDCEVYPSPFAVFLDAQDKNYPDKTYLDKTYLDKTYLDKTYLEPDISVICDRDKLTDEGCEGAPDWIIEIVSPSSRQMDYNKKLFMYRTVGVREYWIVDPSNLRVTVYNFEHDIFGEYSFSDKVKAGIYEDLEIDFSGIDVE